MKNKKNRHSILVLFSLSMLLIMLFFTSTVSAQNKIILTGKVVDSITGKAMSGVSVLALNNKGGGVVTKEDGTFSLEITKKDCNFE